MPSFIIVEGVGAKKPLPIREQSRKSPSLIGLKTVPIVIYCCFALHNICEMGRICEVDNQEVQAQIQRHKRDEEKTPNCPGAFCSYINSEG